MDHPWMKVMQWKKFFQIKIFENTWTFHQTFLSADFRLLQSHTIIHLVKCVVIMTPFSI
jgi:hypothetical protein